MLQGVFVLDIMIKKEVDMDTSVFVAKIFGLCYLIFGIGFMFNRKIFQQLMEDFCKNVIAAIYGGIFSLVIGVVLILTHNIWVANWTVMITIIGWLAFIKGIWLIVFPNTVFKFMQAYKRNEKMLILHAAAVIILGTVFTFFGFFVG